MLKKLKQKILAIFFKKNVARSKNEATIGEVYYED